MAESKTRRVDIGFHGGQVLAVRVSEEAYQAMHKALNEGGSERWHELTTLDSEVSIDLAQVVYLRHDTEDQRVGF